MLLGLARARAGDRIEDLDVRDEEGLSVVLERKSVRAVVDLTCDRIDVGDDDVTIHLRVLGPATLEALRWWMVPVLWLWRLCFGDDFERLARAGGLAANGNEVALVRPRGDLEFLGSLLADRSARTVSVETRIDEGRMRFELPQGERFEPDLIGLTQWFLSRRGGGDSADESQEDEGS